MRVRLLALALVGALAVIAVSSSSAVRSAKTADAAVFQGLGTWVDIFDGKLLAQPEATAAAIAARGVETVYVETANSKQKVDIVRPDRIARLVDALHANGVRAVAWYLPSFLRPALDLRRSLAAIRLVTPAGGGFDGFALDIESSAVKATARRNVRLLDVSQKLRAAVGESYPLGAIIPSPRGMEIRPTYWNPFPYAELAAIYDTFLPMVYSSYSVKDSDAVYGYTARSLAIIRQRTARADFPIHLVGGVSDRLTPAAVTAFAQAAADDGKLLGWSLYDWATTTPATWATIAAIPTLTTGTATPR